MKKMFIRAYCQSNLGDDLFVFRIPNSICMPWGRIRMPSGISQT